MKINESYLNSPLGLLKLTVKDDKLVSIIYENNKFKTEGINSNNSDLILDTKKQLNEYFKGQRKDFDISLDIQGTEFEKDIYRTLMDVKYGEVTTYKKLAQRSGHPKAYRAVGTALKKNKIPIIVPCHRVLKSDESIGNYNGGKWRKEKLLSIEGFLS
ncbi:MAG: methylated-DNA--[protein]-cysteine S-methyltransferase [Halanaerobiales bacterium]|nr:methylated-DNA--[protein]-cysteine S-methyltransferase [Halanaerobiales bacterium]